MKALYLGTPVTGTVVTTKVDGAPQRVVRTDLVDHLESQSWLRSLPRALRSAYRFRQETGATFASLLREGRAMKEGNELTWAQVVMAANAPVMTKAALVEGQTDVGVLPTGQVVGVIESLPHGGRHRRRRHDGGRRRAARLDRLSPLQLERLSALGANAYALSPLAAAAAALPWATRRSRFDTRWCVTPKRWAMLGML